jgi:hypothetical protein
MNDEIEHLIDYWHFRATRMQTVFYEASRIYNRRHYWLGGPAVTLNVLVGTAIFASLSQRPELSIQVAVGFLSVSAALLTGIQTFLNYSDLAEKHKRAGAQMAHLRHSMEILKHMPPATELELRQELSDFESMWDKLRQESPHLPFVLWARVEKDLTFESYVENFKKIKQ